MTCLFSIFNNIQTNDGQWSSWCFYWDKSGRAKVYKDGIQVGRASNFARNIEIRPGGIWVVGQNQRGVAGGNFQKRHAFEGEISNVNIYSGSRSNLKSLLVPNSSTTCPPTQYTDIVKSWRDFRLGVVGNFEKLVVEPRSCRASTALCRARQSDIACQFEQNLHFIS